MPKKTKKEKIIAFYRRKLKLLGETKEPVPPKEETNPYFLSDLRKSFILGAVVVALEISLYFANIIK
jgi:hypothetical protein